MFEVLFVLGFAIDGLILVWFGVVVCGFGLGFEVEWWVGLYVRCVCDFTVFVWYVIMVVWVVLFGVLLVCGWSLYCVLMICLWFCEFCCLFCFVGGLSLGFAWFPCLVVLFDLVISFDKLSLVCFLMFGFWLLVFVWG